MLGIEYPIIRMAWVSDASLAAAVSMAGSGIIGAMNRPGMAKK